MGKQHALNSGADAVGFALKTGRLSSDPKAANFACNYEYVGTELAQDVFRHRETGERLP